MLEHKSEINNIHNSSIAKEVEIILCRDFYAIPDVVESVQEKSKTVKVLQWRLCCFHPM